MSKRFDSVISNIDSGLGVIDVGTDHGYIPIQLAMSGFEGNIYATDINSLPLKKAISNAERFNVLDKITFKQCDGLESCSHLLFDTITICGMGGDLICDILDKAEWTMSSEYKLILQPMSKSEILRYWLINNGYSIVSDITIFDKGRYYQLIVSRYTGINDKYSDAELFVGKEHNSFLIKKVLKGLRKIPNNHFYNCIIKELENYDSK